ncbi:Fc receptor-like protein 5 [Pholidichthys leucotaenia]
MQVTQLCLMLTCLQVSPDRSQFFRYDSVSLTCEDQANSTGWKVKRKTSEGGVRSCTSGWGSISSSSTCIIGNIYPTDSGLYWCEYGNERSNTVNIIVTDRLVILDSPATPIPEGTTVTLRCKELAETPNHIFNFYKDGHSISTNSTGKMIIHSITKSDEGLYKCSISGGEESLSSWLAVDAPPTSSTAPSTSSFSAARLLCHLVVGTPYLLSTVLLGLIYRDRKREARIAAARQNRHNVVMEMVI